MIARGQSLVHRLWFACCPLLLSSGSAVYPCVIVQTSIPMMSWILFSSFSNICVDTSRLQATGTDNHAFQVMKVFVLIHATSGCMKDRTLHPLCLLVERMHDLSQVTGH